MAAYIEYGLSRWFAKRRGYDEDLFFNRQPLFSRYPTPTFTVDSADCGPSGGAFDPEYTQDGTSRFPELFWPEVQRAREYLIVCEDPDSPFGRRDLDGVRKPFVFGIFYGIPADRTFVADDDFTMESTGVLGDNKLKGGFRYGHNQRGSIYSAPKPLVGHGPHRFIYTVVALRTCLTSKYLTNRPNVDEIAAKISNEIIGWGSWTKTYERTVGQPARLAAAAPAEEDKPVDHAGRQKAVSRAKEQKAKDQADDEKDVDGADEETLRGYEDEETLVDYEG